MKKGQREDGLALEIPSGDNGGVATVPNGTHSEQIGAALGSILAALQTMRDGDFSVRLPVAWTGLEGKIADTFNDIIAANEQMARELNRVGDGSLREYAR